MRTILRCQACGKSSHISNKSSFLSRVLLTPSCPFKTPGICVIPLGKILAASAISRASIMCKEQRLLHRYFAVPAKA